MYIQDYGLWDYRDLKGLAMDCYYNGLVAITIVVRTRRSAQRCNHLYVPAITTNFYHNLTSDTL